MSQTEPEILKPNAVIVAIGCLVVAFVLVGSVVLGIVLRDLHGAVGVAHITELRSEAKLCEILIYSPSSTPRPVPPDCADPALKPYYPKGMKMPKAG